MQFFWLLMSRRNPERIIANTHNHSLSERSECMSLEFNSLSQKAKSVEAWMDGYGWPPMPHSQRAITRMQRQIEWRNKLMIQFVLASQQHNIHKWNSGNVKREKFAQNSACLFLLAIRTTMIRFAFENIFIFIICLLMCWVFVDFLRDLSLSRYSVMCLRWPCGWLISNISKARTQF